MARLARQQAVAQAMASTVSAANAVEQKNDMTVAEKYDLMTNPEQRRQWINEQYQLVIEGKSAVTLSEVKSIAFLHALENIDHVCMTDPTQLAEAGINLEQKMLQPLVIELLVDHSGSMNGGGQKMATTIAQSMKRYVLKQSPNAIVRVYTFGGPENDRPPMTVEQYEQGLNSPRGNQFPFDSATDLTLAWNRSLAFAGDRVTIIVSDGGFSVPVHNLVANPNIRAMIFFAPEWSPANVTQDHAAALRTKIPDSAMYRGDIHPGDAATLGQVVAQLASLKGVIPELPGRIRLGTMSVPSAMLVPSKMGRLLKATVSTKSWKLIEQLTELYSQLLQSARQDVERCMMGALYNELMSLISIIVKTSEERIGEYTEQKDATSTAVWAKLLLTAKQVRDHMATEYPKLRAVYKHQPAKLKLLDELYLKATTVSEREEIIETGTKKFGAPIGFAEFDNVKSAEALATLEEAFSRVTTMHATPKDKVLDWVLIDLVRSIRVIPVAQYKRGGLMDETITIPVWRDTANKTIDLFSILRFLPAYLRRQQVLHKAEIVSPDYTFQPRAAIRLAMMLNVGIHSYEYESPRWLVQALNKVQPPPMVYSDTDDENVTPFWLKMLLEYDDVLPADVVARTRQRLMAWSTKWFLMKLPMQERVVYTRQVYPGVAPLIITCAAMGQAMVYPYVVFMGSAEFKDSFMNPITGKPILAARVLSDPIEIAKAYEKNLLMEGSYVRPTYMCDGLVTLWQGQITQMDVLRQQLVDQKIFSSMEINAHMQTMRDRGWIQNVSYDAYRNDEKTRDAVHGRIAEIQKLGLEVPPLIEQQELTLFKSDLLRHLIQHTLKRKDQEGKEEKEAKHAQEKHAELGCNVSKWIQAWMAFPALDHNVYANEIDYMIHQHDASKNVQILPRAFPEESKKQVDAVLDTFVRSFDAALDKELGVSVLGDVIKSGLFVTADERDEAKASAKQAKIQASQPNQQAAAQPAQPVQPLQSKEEKFREAFECPITLCVPVIPTLTPCGHMFEYDAIHKVQQSGGSCPVCRAPISQLTIVYALKHALEQL